MDKRIKFYSQNINLLPPKPKSSFRHLKQGIQEFHRKYALVPADKAANNVVVVCRLHFVNTLKQEFDGTRAYLETDTDEVSVVNAHLNDLPVKFSVCANEGEDFDFDIVNFPFLDGDVPRRASYGVYISQLIRFARVCNHVTDFEQRSK